MIILNTPLFSGKGVYSLKDIQGLALCRQKLNGRGQRLVSKLLGGFFALLGGSYFLLSAAVLILTGELPYSMSDGLSAVSFLLMLYGLFVIFGDRLNAKRVGKMLFTKVPIYDNCGFSFELYEDMLLYRNKFTEMSIPLNIADRIYLLDDSIIFVTSETTVTYLPMTAFEYGTFHKAKTYLETAAAGKTRHRL